MRLKFFSLAPPSSVSPPHWGRCSFCDCLVEVSFGSFVEHGWRQADGCIIPCFGSLSGDVEFTDLLNFLFFIFH